MKTGQADDPHMPVDLAKHVCGIIEKHGTVRAAAKALKMDPGYLHRLSTGANNNPSFIMCARLGLIKQTVFRKVWR